MATLALAAVGSAIGSAVMPAGFTLLGATMTGAAIGSQIGAMAGSYVDNALFGSSGQNRTVEGPRLSDLHVTASTEGAPIARLYGRARLGGQIIWATDFEEEIVTTSESTGGGKGGLGGGSRTTTTQYNYYANFALALCEGEISRVGRMWADGREIDTSLYTWRLHKGSATQSVDSLIAAKEGAGNAPAYRGVAYIVFERMALADFGNRVPQLSVEVYRKVEAADADIKGVVLIPGSGEFVYATQPVHRVLAEGVAAAENVHTLQAATDWDAAIDQMQADLPNAKQVSLVVSWFGTDLRAGSCQIKPGVEQLGKTTAPLTWQVAGVARADAYKVSQIDGRAAYGGTPSDQTVIAAIRDMNARGMKVTLTPFILMDVAAGNSLPNPYGGSSQPAYPWRGRITCHPAAGQPGTVDKTAAAATQIQSFVGTAAPAHFSLTGDEVNYSGPAEWSYRRMVLHQAYLAKAAGGVEAFVIGTELRGLSRVRSNANTFPFVSALIALASDVKSVLGPAVKVLYAADWSEYFGYQPSDGTGDVYFHLDPLWASASIDAIGIDVYWPLADWRDGRGHLDYVAGTRSIYDLDYLKANVQGGEGYDWYYASDAARASQTRTPITDGSGKPWVFRYKDIKNWWLNQHYNRPGGVESSTPTAWVPQSKPFWLMEIGCPAVDKGANQPNVFVDPKSIENALPYFSNGVRDDLMQRRFLTAFLHAFDWTKSGYVAGSNPISSLTGTRMVNLDHIHVYCWDARPYPQFPNAIDVWGDGDNWQLGHWVNGRLGTATLSGAVAAILGDHDFADHDTSALNGSVPGYVIDRIMSARDALQPLELAYFFDSIETGGNIAFRHRGQDSIALALDGDKLVETRPGAALMSLTRGQETELPASAKIRYITASDDYRQAVSEARRLVGASGRVAQADLPIMLDETIAAGIAETWLFETWAARERASFALPPTALGLEPGDLVTYSKNGLTRTLRVTEISEHGTREVEARGNDIDVYGRVGVPKRPKPPSAPVQIGQPAAAFLDLPLIVGTEPPESGYVAAVQKPWPGAVAVYASAQTTGYQLKALIDAPATYGVTLDALPPGPEGRVDWKAKVRVKLSSGALASTDRISMLSGTNLAAVRAASGEWELIQFATATLVDVATYEISELLRGQFGTEAAMTAEIAAGATFVVLDAAVARVPLSLSTLNLPLNWKYGAANRNIGDASYAVTQHAFKGIGLRPLSPAHVTASRNGAGDVTLAWKRRTRIGGDSWDASDVPLAEDSERYEIDVMAGAVVKRTLSSSSPDVIYTGAQQIADFGAVQGAVAVRVCQISATYGRGAVRAATV